MTSLAEEMLTDAITWVYSANDDVANWEKVREEAKKDAAGVSSDDEEDRRLRRHKADAEFRMADVGRTASREIQRAALQELGSLQREVFVKDIEVSEPSYGNATAMAVLRKGRTIPAGYRFYWTAGGADIRRNDSQWLAVTINVGKLPAGDTVVEAILGKDAAPPVPGM